MNLDSISEELDRLYQFEISEYIARCSELKSKGYRIFRNPEGKHKVKLAGQPGKNHQAEYSEKKRNAKEESLPARVKRSVRKRLVKALIRLVNNLSDT